MLPFWDECSDESRENGIPSALTAATFVLDGTEIPNPLRSFTLPVEIADRVQGDPIVYSKPTGYETVRYPLSGLVGTLEDLTATKAHNAQFLDAVRNIRYLNDNVSSWLGGKIKVDGVWVGELYDKFIRCLDAPNYTLFSNTTSTGAYNKAHGTKIVSLESPHNAIHLAVGGFDYPGQFDASPIPGANGDMGENDTAGLDPIFFFHHCFIDYVFWIWQRRHDVINTLEIDANDPGANSDANPPPAGIEPNTPLTLDTTLEPFRLPDGQVFGSKDCTNIETQLGYTYGPGSLDRYAQQRPVAETARSLAVTPAGRTLRISGVDRAKIRGSFLISAFVNVDGKRQHLGTEAVLSRWHVEGCMNCQNHLEATAHFGLPTDAVHTVAIGGEIEVEVRTRHGLLGGSPRSPRSATSAAAARGSSGFNVEII
jgi:tyrosinase